MEKTVIKPQRKNAEQTESEDPDCSAFFYFGLRTGRLVTGQPEIP
jgi:hypothetical protein